MLSKIFSVLLAALMILSCVTGCAEKNPSDTTAEVTDQTTQATETTGETTEATEETTEPATEPVVLELNRNDITLVTAGETWDLYDGQIPEDQITWSSDDPAVATMENGVVTAVSKGSTNVHGEYNGVKVSCIIHCNLRITEPTQPQTDPVTPPSSSDSRVPVKNPPSTATVSSSFFDDAVFVGDSVTLKLSYYAANGSLGGAKFLVRGSYGMGHAANGTMLLTYQGSEYSIEDAVLATGAQKLFIMLGMNDIALYGIDKTIENWGTVVGRIRAKNPNVQIYIQSMTPVWTGGEKGSLNNTNADAFNVRLQAFAQSNNCTYIDVASYMKDSTGGLATSYCSDSFVHVTDAGAAAWVKVLLAFNY